MSYQFDEQDAQFCLFEWLDPNATTNLAPFKEHNEDLQKMVMTELAKFCANELEPIWASGDREGCRMEDGQVIAPKGYKEAYQKFAQNGFIGLDVPTTYGGQGLPTSLCVALNEAIIGSNVSFSLYQGLTRGSSHLIETFGTEDLAKRFCPKMYDGTWGGTMCLTEPQAGSAVGDIKTTAKPLGDGTYAIEGNKIFISSGDHDLTENNIHLVLARVEGDPEGTKGISLFIVPKIWVNEDGSLGDANDVSCVNIEHKMGIKASATASLNFGENGKCRGYLIGTQAKGMSHMFQMMNEARLLVGIQGEALAATAFNHAVQYAKERTQFGDTQIIDYPAVRRDLALCKAYVEGMRAMLYYTGHQEDLAKHSEDATQKERAQNRVDLLTPICKAYCADIGFKVTELALQTYGGYGYISEYPMEQLMRDAKIASIYEGTNAIQALDLMGRKLAIKEGTLFRELYEDLSQFAEAHMENAGLKDEVAGFKKSLDTVAQVAMTIAGWGMSGDKVRPMCSANPFLEMCGHVVVSYFLLNQAVTAQEKISSGSDTAFYRNKIRTAKFFATHVLPHAIACAKDIQSGDISAMEIEY